jgi:hypothetical protein
MNREAFKFLITDCLTIRSLMSSTHYFIQSWRHSILTKTQFMEPKFLQQWQALQSLSSEEID